MTTHDWLAILNTALPGYDDVGSGPPQEYPQGVGLVARVWQSGLTTLVDEGQREIEWTVDLARSARGQQDLGVAYEAAWVDAEAVVNAIDRTVYSITMVQGGLPDTPVRGYAVVRLAATESVEEMLSW